MASASRADEIDSLIGQAMQREEVPGMALLVMHSGKAIRLSTYGLANLEQQ
ncbi:MAG: hypothetical protein JOZ12_06740, partial [Sinobacteraceae bacterium]|nr:hypothetical protein [Nevskiaceae bacterium]